MKRRLVIVATAGLALVVTLALWTTRSSQRGVVVNVRNVGAKPMRKVSVIVTGATYAIGDLEPNGQGSVRVNPQGESHVELRWDDGQGNNQSVNAGGYFEPGYRGEMTIDVADGIVAKLDDQVRTR